MKQEKRRSVLVVDDQENWRDLLCELLEDEFDVKRASNYREAQDLILKQKPPFHVVVSDIRLIDDDSKNEDGLRLVEELNQLRDLTKVIVITGYPSIETAKRALGKLAVYDYLEKKPADGRPFDPVEFRHIVSQASNEVERQRVKKQQPDALHIPGQVLIIEANVQWREKLANVLRPDGYHVDEMENTTLLYSQINDQRQLYDLLIVNETFLDERFFNFQRSQPNMKVIVLTRQTFAALLRKMQEHAALSAFPLSQDFEVDEFRKTVHRALSAEITKYIKAAIEGVPEPEILHLGKAYRLVLSLNELHQRNAIPVELTPKIAGERISLTVFVYAPQMRFQNTELFWKIPAKGSPSPLELEFVPEEVGQLTITIELEQDNRWLGRIEKKVEVR